VQDHPVIRIAALVLFGTLCVYAFMKFFDVFSRKQDDDLALPSGYTQSLSTMTCDALREHLGKVVTFKKLEAARLQNLIQRAQDPGKITPGFNDAQLRDASRRQELIEARLRELRCD
jgi:hypothetical protein